MEVISVFAGLGKTTLAKKYRFICDLQSTKYRYFQGYAMENSVLEVLAVCHGTYQTVSQLVEDILGGIK